HAAMPSAPASPVGRFRLQAPRPDPASGMPTNGRAYRYRSGGGVEGFQAQVQVGFDGLAGGVEALAGGGAGAEAVVDAGCDDADLEVGEGEVEVPVGQAHPARRLVGRRQVVGLVQPVARPGAGFAGDQVGDRVAVGAHHRDVRDGIADGGQLPVDDGGHARAGLQVEDGVVDAVVAVDDAGGAL